MTEICTFFTFTHDRQFVFAYKFLGNVHETFSTDLKSAWNSAENADNKVDYLKAETYLFSFSLEAVPDLATARPVYIVLILQVSHTL